MSGIAKIISSASKTIIFFYSYYLYVGLIKLLYYVLFLFIIITVLHIKYGIACKFHGLLYFYHLLLLKSISFI